MNQPLSSAEPVVVCMGRVLLAFDQPSGAVKWSFVAESSIQRLFRVGGRVLCSSGALVVCVDVQTGRHVGSVDIGFQPDAGLVCGTDLLLADGTASGPESPRLACVTADGQIRWRATVETRGPENVLRTYGGGGDKRSEVRYARSGYRAGILHGQNVAQPDRD
jgi:hypothetical protein